MKTAAIEIKDITKVYQDHCVLDISELTMYSSGFVAITGDSGSGKTTLLNAIGLLDECDTGTISFFNNTVDKSDADKCSDFRETYIGYMFQDDILFRNRTVKDNIAYPLEISNLKNYDEEIYRVMQTLSMEEFLSRYPHELSRGQRQRVALARAVVGDKKIILADEPTGNLDVENSQIIFEYLKKLSRDRLVIIATHNIELAQKYADRIIQLVDGKIEKDYTMKVCDDQEVSLPGKSGVTKKKRHNRSLIMKHALCDVKSEFKNLRKVFVSGALMTIIFVLTIATFTNSKAELRNLENNYFGKNYICLTPNMNYSLETALGGMGRYLGDCSFLDQNEDILEHTEYYIDSLTVEKGMDNFLMGNLTAIKCNEFYKEKVNYLGIEGSMISEDNEIILASDVAEWYYGTDYAKHIGENIEAKAVYGKYEFKVVGFNHKKDVNGKLQTYMTQSAMQDVAHKEASQSCGREAARIYGPNSYKITNNDVSEDDRDDMAFYSENEYMIDESKASYVTNHVDDVKIVAGEKPQNAEEAMISKTFLLDNGQDLFGLVMDDSNIDSDDFLKKYIFGNELYIVFDYMGTINKVKITGIFEFSGSEDVIVSDEGLEQLSTVYPCRIDLFLKDHADIEKITTEVFDAGLCCEQPYEDYKDGISGRFSMIKIVFGVMAAVVLMVLIVVINTFTSNNIQNRKKDIGLLMAMGMHMRDIKKVYIVESSLLGVFTEMMAVLILVVLKIVMQIINGQSITNWTALLNFGLPEIILAVLLGIVVFSLAAIPAVDKNTRLTPKEAIYH